MLQSKYTVRNVHILVKSHRSEDILKRLILLKSITVFKLLGNSQFLSPTFSICSGLLVDIINDLNWEWLEFFTVSYIIIIYYYIGPDSEKYATVWFFLLLVCCSIVYNLSLCLSYCLVWRINVFILPNYDTSYVLFIVLLLVPCSYDRWTVCKLQNTKLTTFVSPLHVWKLLSASGGFALVTAPDVGWVN